MATDVPTLLAALASANPDKRERAIQSAMNALADLPRVDATGAPTSPLQSTWEDLRASTKEIVRAVGLPVATSVFGGTSADLRDTIYRRDPPGRGRRARVEKLLRLVK